jgi:uncharacterized membrane protein HdeD (DUF308 family)
MLVAANLFVESGTTFALQTWLIAFGASAIHSRMDGLRIKEESTSAISDTLRASLVKELSMAHHFPFETIRQASTLSILWGVLLIVFGMFAVGAPFVAAVAVSIAVAWLIVLAGVVHLMLAFHAHRAGRFVWKLLVGLAYVFFGVYLILHPVLGVASLTLVLAVLFLIEGALNVILFFQMRSMRGAFWVLVDGIVTLLLGLMIYFQWPSSAVWAIGILVGVSMIISGLTRVMLSLSVRKVAAVGA